VNPAARLRRLPARSQRALALLGLFLALVMLVVMLIVPVVAKHRDYAQFLIDSRFRLERTRASLERMPQVREQVQALKERSGNSDLYLEDKSPSVAGAEIQQRLSALADTAGVNITSSRVREPETRDGLVLIGVDLELHGPTAEVAAFLRQVEQARPLLLVRELNLERDDRRTPRNRKPWQPVVLGVDLVVRGLMRSGGG